MSRIYIPLAERHVRVGYERDGLGVHRSILGRGWTVCLLGCGHRAAPKGLPYWHARRLCDALSIIGNALHLNWSMGPGELKHTLDGMELTGPLTELTHGRIQRRVSARKLAAEFLRKYRVFHDVPMEYWLSIKPSSRAGILPTKGYPLAVTMFLHSGVPCIGINGVAFGLEARFFNGAKWSRRETPADPFEEVTT